MTRILLTFFTIRQAAAIMRQLAMPGRIGLRINPDFRLLVRIHRFVLVMGMDAVDISDDAFEAAMPDVDPQYLADMVAHVRTLQRVYEQE